MDMFKQLSLAGIVPVIKVKNAQDAVPLCKALSDGGLPVAEITFRTDAAEEAIGLVHDALPDVLLGAGTVLTCEQADRAMNAGAGYIVSPGLNPEVVRHCLAKGYPVLPGCGNPSDIEAALALGLKTVKFFPAEALGGLKLIKAMAAPYGDVTFVPTGGINEKNIAEYLSFPKIVACGGSWMVPEDAIAAQDWERIRELAKNAVSLMLGFTLAHIGINAENAETSIRSAKLLAAALGWPIKEGNSSNFVGTAVEVMKKQYLGTHGHIAIACNSVDRAMWHLEKRGFAFNMDTAAYTPDGRMKVIYLKDEFAGFAVHFVLK